MISVSDTTLSVSQLELAGRFGQRLNALGFTFFLLDTAGRVLLASVGPGYGAERKRCPASLIQQVLGQAGPEVQALGDNAEAWAVALKVADGSAAFAVVERPATADGIEHQGFCGKPSTTEQRANAQSKRLPLAERCIEQMLALFAENFQESSRLQEQIELVGCELAQTYEELVLLYKMSTNMQVTQSAYNYLQMACDGLTELVNVEGMAILLEKFTEGEKHLVVSAGSGRIDLDEHLSAILYSRLAAELGHGKEALLDSAVDSAFKYEWPAWVKSVIAVPLYGNDRVAGAMVAVNRQDKADFDSTDVKLFTSVAGGCGVFIENTRLFKELEELFIGSLRALTSSIDAKDEYTRGHSERVAFICRWTAEKLAENGELETEQIDKVYLAGLLHDIGKIGVDEAVLRKPGALTEDEFKQIKTHPLVGAAILSGIKQMADIVPAILYHHERPDGRGYPQGLTGRQIPLAGKILMLADAFDAMTSKRTYRDALSVQQALAEIEKGLGAQFDERVGKAFLESDIEQLWSVMQEGTMGNYYGQDPLYYGSAAVETLIR
jgi:HD-GYP domain-containing protein (c-di-GMP phosphodiesterase class II)